MNLHYTLSLGITVLALSGCWVMQQPVNTQAHNPPESITHPLDGLLATLIETTFDGSNPKFLDVASFTFSRVIRDSNDTNACILIVEYDMSLGTTFAHWLIYEPNRILFRVQWTPDGLVDLPVERDWPRELIKIPNRRNRPVYVSDGVTEKRVGVDFRFSELDPLHFLYPYRESDEDDPFNPFTHPSAKQAQPNPFGND
ncbi:MAG: hypothetical protein FWG50_12330 [Kiritimatiellaeota bacterium]|nr:hypothetical protein [Kiritimatiellota bacterium]